MIDFEASSLLPIATFNVTQIVVAYAAVLIQQGGSLDPVLLAKVVLATKLNVFAAPLLPTRALEMPLWITYLVVVMWLAQAVYYSNHSVSSILDEVDTALTGGGR